MSIREFIDCHFHHFNAGEVRKSANSLVDFTHAGNIQQEKSRIS